MSHEDCVVPGGNLSVAWARAFLRVFDAPGGELAHPLLLSITEFNELREPVENADIRDALDETIDALNKAGDKRRLQGVSATASTIFPHMCWSPRAARPAAELFEHYKTRVYPRLKKVCSLNSHGTYFLRMVECPSPRSDGTHVNQLGSILDWWWRDQAQGKRTRRSAMQVSVYDPPRDHTGSGQGGFPCLQQVSFGWSDRGLVLSAYYPTEWILDRGYGNYLGLCQLGAFMAHEMKLPLERVNIFVALPERGSVSKAATQALTDRLREYEFEPEPATGGAA
ncbi:MAG: thymidylate synthase [Phycisphaerales bacterium]